MKPAFAWLLAACAGTATTPISAQTSAAPNGPEAKGGYVAAEERKPLSPQAEDTLRRINAYRAAGAQCGTRRMDPAPPVQWNDALERAAAVQVRDMARRGVVAHDGSDGSSVADRITRQNYTWGSAGENAAAGNATVPATLAQWMASPGHCTNLMGSQFKDVAVAGVQQPGSSYGWFWIMVLAAPMQ